MVNKPPRSRDVAVRWNQASLTISAISVGLVVATLIARIRDVELSRYLLLALLISFVVTVALLSRFLLRAHRNQWVTTGALTQSAQQLEEMAEHIQEVFWIIDVPSKRPLYINSAFDSVFGRGARASLFLDPLSVANLVHHEDIVRMRERVLRSWPNKQLDESFRTIRPDGELRWIRVRSFPVIAPTGEVKRVVGTALDISPQVAAEQQVLASLATAEDAWQEADSLRRATLSLTQDLRMNSVTSTLLKVMSELIPYTCARILIPQSDTHYLVLAEERLGIAWTADHEEPIGLDADKVPLLQQLQSQEKGVLCADTANERGWTFFEGHQGLRSWLGVPLSASGQCVGFLSVGHAEPGRLDERHLRRAELLAIPAAAAIQNARLYARAQIYAEELERTIAELHQAENALQSAIVIRKSSEESFKTVFHSSPVAFAITTIDGVFLEVNRAFETHYGYTRSELDMVSESSLWEDTSERRRVAAEIKARGHIRGALTRLRTKSGAIKLTSYSADRIEFQEQSCILAVLVDAPPLPARNWN